LAKSASCRDEWLLGSGEWMFLPDSALVRDFEACDIRPKIFFRICGPDAFCLTIDIGLDPAQKRPE
jgi:hypothetical protein